MEERIWQITRNDKQGNFSIHLYCEFPLWPTGRAWVPRVRDCRFKYLIIDYKLRFAPYITEL